MTAEEIALAGLLLLRKMPAPGWFKSSILRRSFGFGKFGLGTGACVLASDECS